jgi:hypothetical protein
MSLRTVIERAIVENAECETLDGGPCAMCIEKAANIRMAVTQFLFQHMQAALSSAHTDAEQIALRRFWNAVNAPGVQGIYPQERQYHA